MTKEPDHVDSEIEGHHVDGSTKHVDSGSHKDSGPHQDSRHSDSYNHKDSGHQDSSREGEEESPHVDGNVPGHHVDGQRRHIDSGSGEGMTQESQCRRQDKPQYEEEGEIDVPPIARVVFRSEKKKKEWKPFLQKMSQLFSRAEYEMTKRGHRDAATIHINPWNLGRRIEKIHEDDMVFTPIRKTKKYGGFSHKHLTPNKGDNYVWYGALTRDKERGLAFRESSFDKESCHLDLGKLLGFPKCCTDWFDEVWEEGRYDPIWRAAKNTVNGNVEGNRINIDAHFLSNPVLRYFGARIISHLPHSFQCEESKEIGEQWFEVMEDIDEDTAHKCKELLEKRTVWDSYRGVARVRNDIFEGVANTYPFEERKVVILNGD